MSTVYNTPDAVLEFVQAQAPALRQKYGQALMAAEADGIGLIMTDTIRVTYHALGVSTYLPEFIQITSRYLLEGFNLSWIMGLHLRTPGPLFEKLPLQDSLILPIDRLPDLQASLCLKRHPL